MAGHSCVEQVWDGGDLARLSEFWADSTRHEAEGLHHTLTAAFPDLRVVIEDVIAEDDKSSRG